MPWCSECQRVIINGGCGCADIRDPQRTESNDGSISAR